jgi:hypothetical protein
VLAAVSCWLLLAACGSSAKPSGGAGASAGIKFADCMRSHGVANFPDPGAGGGIQITAGSGIDRQSPAFRSAQTACAKLLPGGGPVGGSGSESRKLQLVKLAECMRAHGVPSFPDPTTTPPSAPPSGGGVAFGAPGAFLSVPQTLIQSPAFEQAATDCGFPGTGRKIPKPATAG